MGLAMAAASEAGSARYRAIGCEAAVWALDDGAGVAVALTRIVSAKSMNNIKSIETSVLPAASSSAARSRTRVTKSAKALRAPGEVGNDFWTTRGQVLSALSSGGEKARRLEICCSTLSRSALRSSSA